MNGSHMRWKMKLRDKSMTILLFVVFSVIFTALWNIADLAARAKNQSDGTNAYQNMKTVKVRLTRLEDILSEEGKDAARKYAYDESVKLMEALRQSELGNISVPSFEVPVRYKQHNVPAEIVVRQNEELPYQIKESYEDSAVVLVGESLNKYLRETDGTPMIDIGNGTYPVGAVLKNYGFSNQDERVIIRYEALDEVSRQKVNELLGEYFWLSGADGIRISLGSTSEESIEQAYAYMERVTAELDGVEISAALPKTYPGGQNFWAKRYHSQFGSISVVFSIICGMAVSSLWFQRKRRELLIRRIFGYNVTRIWLLVWKELGQIAAASLAFSTVLWIVILLCRGRSLLWGQIGLQGLIMLGGAVAVIFITTLYPFVKAMSLDPADGLNRYRG